MSRRAAALAAVLWLWLGAVPTAHAEDASAARVRALASRAAHDPSARAALGRIDRVDGRSVAVGAILAGARPDEVEPRIRLALRSADASGEAAGAGAPRARAQELLRDRRYTGTALPRPFVAPLRWLGDRLDPVARAIRRLADAFPGGSNLFYVLLALAIILAAAALSSRVLRRGAGRSGAAGRAVGSARGEDPARLERDADAAERDGRWEEAVRLRFRAGLLRLDAERVIAFRPSLTTGEVARTLRSPDFDALGRDFDAIAYGGRPAEPQDAATARERWQTVLAGTGAR